MKKQAEIIYDEGIKKGLKKLFKDAIDDFDAVIKLDPTFVKAYRERGVVNNILNRYDESVEDFKKVIELRPESNTDWYNFTLAYNDKYNSKKTDEEKAAVKSEYNNYFHKEFVENRFEHLHNSNSLMLKTMDKEWVEKSLHDGEFYFRPSKFFRELEDSDSRKDSDDNRPQTMVLIPENVEVKLTGKPVSPPPSFTGMWISGSGTVKDFKLEIGGFNNIYCTSIVNSSNYEHFLKNNDIKKFGDYVLVIQNPKEFISRLKQKKTELKDNYVTYIPKEEVDKRDSIFNPFIKGIKYKDEYEYRFCYNQGRDAETVTIGNIEGIATMIPVSEINQYAKTYFENNR